MKKPAVNGIVVFWGVVIFVLVTSLLAGEIQQKVIRAVCIQDPITVDGWLREPAWQTMGYSDFIQSEPVDGGIPSEKTIVWVAYDEKYLYVAARCFDSQPEKIMGLLARRDEGVDSDWFWVDIDPYYDRRSGYRFAINPANTIVDGILYNDVESDNVWDGVWDASTRCDGQGWSVEIRIPFNQLRFKKQDHYVWGINFRRNIKRKNEEQTYSWIPKEESGYVSRFARVEGIQNIRPGRHVEWTPFSVSKATFKPFEPYNPFETGEKWAFDAGFDLKYALKSNLILDLTVNPDFGEVELDPAEINLEAVETYFEEKRPFFIEGTSIFQFGMGGVNEIRNLNWESPDFFYSRRIGRWPQVRVIPIHEDMYIQTPDFTSILGAAKLTGKLGKGWNIGLLNALTSREYVKVEEFGTQECEQVEPFSYYGVFRLLKEFHEGRQGLGILGTSLIRDLNAPQLNLYLVEQAYSLAIDGWTMLDKNNTWAISGWLGGTWLKGSPGALLGIKRSFPHYYQRPDAGHLSLNPDDTTMDGWAGRLVINKQKGHLTFNAALGAISPGFHSAEMGYQSRGDIINGHVSLGYRSYHPGKLFRNWSVLAAAQKTYDFEPVPISSAYYFDARGQFLNYWGMRLLYIFYPDQYNKEYTRGGPLVIIPSFSWFYYSFYSDTRKPVVFYIRANYQEGRNDFSYGQLETEIEIKARSNLSFSIVPSFEYFKSDLMRVTSRPDPLMVDTYGTRYIFSNIDRKTFSAELRMNWTFSPRLSLQLYLQPYIDVADYSHFKELARSRSFEFNAYGQGNSLIDFQDGLYLVDPDGPGSAPLFYFNNPDFNYVSLRGTLVFRWEFKPRSTLYLVWTQSRDDLFDDGHFRFNRDMGRLFDVAGMNMFVMKLTYRFQL